MLMGADPMQRAGQQTDCGLQAVNALEDLTEVAVHSHCSVVRFATATGACPAQRRNAGGATHSNSRGALVAPLLTRADKRAETPSARSATPFRDDERGSPQGPLTARPGAGIDEPVPAGAANSASVTPRNCGRGREADRTSGLTPIRLHQIAKQSLSDRAPAVRFPLPARRSVRMVPSINAVTARERCGRDRGLDLTAHHQPLSAGNIFARAADVPLKQKAFAQ